MTTTVEKCWMKKEKRKHLYLRDSKVMDGNQCSPDLLRIVRNLWAGWSRKEEKEKEKRGCSIRGNIDGNV